MHLPCDDVISLQALLFGEFCESSSLILPQEYVKSCAFCERDGLLLQV